MFSPAINMHKNYDINYTKKENGDEKYGDAKETQKPIISKRYSVTLYDLPATCSNV